MAFAIQAMQMEKDFRSPALCKNPYPSQSREILLQRVNPWNTSPHRTSHWYDLPAIKDCYLPSVNGIVKNSTLPAVRRFDLLLAGAVYILLFSFPLYLLYLRNILCANLLGCNIYTLVADPFMSSGCSSLLGSP